MSGLETFNKSLRKVDFIVWVIGSPEHPEVASTALPRKRGDVVAVASRFKAGVD